jgi:hypothetical protein
MCSCYGWNMLMMLFVGFWDLCSATVPSTHVEAPAPRIHLHADGEADLAIPGRAHVRVGHAGMLREVRAWHEAHSLRAPMVSIVVDDSVPWGDFVESVSSVSHITGGQVAVVSDED